MDEGGDKLGVEDLPQQATDEKTPVCEPEISPSIGPQGDTPAATAGQQDPSNAEEDGSKDTTADVENLEANSEPLQQVSDEPEQPSDTDMKLESSELSHQSETVPLEPTVSASSSSDENMESITADFVKVDATQVGEAMEYAEEKQEESTATDAEGGTDKGKEDKNIMDVLGNGKIIKKILEAGQGFDTRPAQSHLVTISFTASLQDGGTVVEKEKEFQFALGEGDVITGLDLAVSLMELGEKASIVINPEFAYGDLGRTPDIPENASLEYEIELINSHPPPDLSKAPFQARFDLAEKKRLRGNYLFQRYDFAMAVNSYTKALTLMNNEGGAVSAEEQSELQECMSKCHNNMAACQIKLEAYKAGISSCNAVLRIEPSNVKAHFRKGKAHALLGEHEEAIEWMKKALQLEPSNKNLQQELNITMRKYQKEEDKQRSMYSKMLGSPMPAKEVKERKRDKDNAFPYWLLFSASSMAAGLLAIGYAVYKMANVQS